jgi:hypothetical protein
MLGTFGWAMPVGERRRSMPQVDKGTKLRSSRAELTVQVRPPAILLLTVQGYWEGALMSQVIRELDRFVHPRTGLHFFVDAEMLTGYDSEVRVALTEWVRTNRPALRSVHALVRSKIVAMGTSVANLALGNFLIAHSSRSDFERAMNAANGGGQSTKAAAAAR